jgi:hypothetical protein
MTIPFEGLDPANQRRVVSELLMGYSKWDYEKRASQCYSMQLNGGAIYSMPYEVATKLAVNYMLEDNKKARKFETLVQKMKEQGMGMFYNYTMGEDIERALK